MKRKKVIYVTTITIVFILGFIGFRIFTNMNDAKNKAAAMTRGRVLTVEVMPAFNKNIIPLLTFTASLEPVWHSDLSPKVDGRIETLYTDEAQKVAAGQIVGKLENMEFAAQVSQAQGTLYSVGADLAQAKSDLARNKMLVEQGALSQQQYEAAMAKVASLEGQMRASQGNLGYQQSRLGFTDIVTPHAGTVMTRYLQAGDYAKAGTPIFTVADTSVMLAKTTVGEGQITQVKLGDPAQVLVESLSDQPFNGKITKIVPAAAVPARTFTLEVSIDNSQDTLLSGLTAKVMANGKEHMNALVVPESALVLFEDQKTVFVLSNDQVVQRKLRVGYIGNGWAEVLSGLNPGDLIVVKGQNTIRDGSKVQVTATREAGQL
ncbi:efflux RND transporter periplasmic adaptor subunit [Pelosinus sp. sgz500959]|uniref:efflux RND transporter periplasmic adaptor subunit n=1 Tax=Pelosinus sp. sgz500959 TaxID=3242472 RepID=UPI003670503E